MFTIWSVINNSLIYATVTIGNNRFINQSMHFKATFKTFRNGIALHACGACVTIKIFVAFMSSWLNTFPLYHIT
ncbi:dna-binding protein [Lasius niger]|uniref:Dna-binding protein n=1 Tax=Lasius niger TaxID=67767 RepID=A0A0J7MR16_LASNI|nr:dna-binding protein [Lasius niger]